MTSSLRYLVDLQVSTQRYALVRPFRTARRDAGAAATAIRVDLCFEGDVRGRGISVPIVEATGETVDGALGALRGPIRLGISGIPVDDIEGAMSTLAKVGARHGAACAAVDMAWHDALQQIDGDPPSIGPVLTDVTIPVQSTGGAVVDCTERVAQGFRVLKIKADDRPDIAAHLARIAAALPGGTVLRIDANQAWDERTTLVHLEEFARRQLPIGFVEQPVAAADLAAMACIRANSPFPIMADESVATTTDVERLADAKAADGIIVKLAKAGGSWAARQVVAAAQGAGLRVVVGSMLEPIEALRPAIALAHAEASAETHDLDAGLWFAGSARFYQPPYLCVEPA